jgi:hypothetical protein
MDLIGALSMLAMPFVVKFVTNYAKQLSLIKFADYRIAIIRAVVALLSLVGALLSQAIGDGAVVGSDLIGTTFLTVVNAGVATWLYLKGKEASK